ncbi:MAG TPA: beta-galactosidase [Anaerolineales bacterium]|nr:beta-galactosidase [Anaerolineales bacterium]
MFYFGVDYYPEQWPEERWEIDARLMAEANFNVVRLVEFAWSRMEPVEDQFDFDWLDRAIGILQSQGISVVLGTPTASPPPWLMSQSPEFFRVREDGVRLTFGNRREYCPNNPVYHEYTQRIVTKMAEHYAGHPAVIGWQIDNEFGDRCYCSICARKFQTWLRSRYEALEELNQKWGTVFWSHIYNDWNEIPLPLTTGGSPNPGLALDFYRFCSDSYVAYQQMQVDILRAQCPDHFITHNLMGFGYDRLNYFDLAHNLDFVAWDNYPRMQWTMERGVDPSSSALSMDTMRGLKRKNIWVMEQQAGSGGWEMISVAPRPGELRLWAYQAIAHGADAIVFFRWRTARFGTEQYWHGLLDHNASPSRRYEEIKRMGAEIKELGGQILGSQVKAPVAMMLSYDSRFAFQIQPNNPGFSYPEHFHQIYRAFYGQHASIDIISPNADLSTYRLVLAPALHLITQATAENLKRYVQAGGTLVVTQRTGVKDESNTVVDQRLPGLLAEICGVEVEEYDSLSSQMQNSLEFTVPELVDGACPTVGVLCDILKPTSAEVLARYTGDYYAGKPAITLNRFGAGRAMYIGAVGNPQLYDRLAKWLLDTTGLQNGLAAPPGVELARRTHSDGPLRFILNHNNTPQTIHLESPCMNLLDGMQLTGDVQLAPFGVLILASPGP